MVDAFRKARENFSDSGWDSYAAQRADIQAKNTYTSIAQQAMTWVPLLNIVLTVVFYAMFPVIFPLFLFPRTGPTTLKGYATGFFYLAAWGPLYVVLHMFVMSRAANAMSAMAPTAPTLLVIDGIQSVNNDIATVAGFLMMSVPFIAAGMARGAMAIAGHSTSMLAPAQNAAEQAANERTTGNYAYGNVSMMNSTANTMQANKWDSTPTYATGAMSSSFMGANGVATRGFADGSTSWDSRNGMSFLPEQISARQGVSFAISQSLAAEQANHRRISEAEVVSSGVGRANSFTHSTGFSSSTGTEWQSGRQSGTNSERYAGSDLSVGEKVDVGQRFESGNRNANTVADQQSSSQSDNFNYGMSGGVSFNGGASVGTGGGAKGTGASAGVQGSLGGNAERRWSDIDQTEHSNRDSQERHTSNSDTVSRDRYGDDRDSSGHRDSISSGTYDRSGGFGRQEQSTSDTNSNSLTFSSNEEKRRALEESQERMDRLSQTLSRVKSGEVTIAGDVTTPVASLYEQYRLENPDEFLPHVAAPNVDPVQHARRAEKMYEIAEQYLRPSIEGHIASAAYEKDFSLDIVPPDPGAQYGFSRSSDGHGRLSWRRGFAPAGTVERGSDEGNGQL